MYPADAIHGSEEVIDDRGGGVRFGGQVECAGGLVEDGGAGLDDAEFAHGMGWFGLDHDEIPSAVSGFPGVSGTAIPSDIGYAVAATSYSR